MKRGTGGKEPGEHCWILFAIIGNGFQLLDFTFLYFVGKTTHRWPGVPKTRTRTHGETHIEEAALRAASTKGGGRLRRPPPFVDSSIWVSPWVRVRVFGTPGQRCVVLPMGFSMGLSTQHWTICPLSYGCPPIKPARELEMSRPPKSTRGAPGPRIRNECPVRGSG